MIGNSLVEIIVEVHTQAFRPVLNSFLSFLIKMETLVFDRTRQKTLPSPEYIRLYFKDNKIKYYIDITGKCLAIFYVFMNNTTYPIS